MRTTIIPAQITSVEDTIAGNLNMTQLLLLIFPVFLSCIIYVVAPTTMSFNTSKYILIGIISFTCITLSIRYKGILLLNWMTIISTYIFRPKLYVFNKQSHTSRSPIFLPKKKKIVTVKKKKVLQSIDTTITPTQDYTSILRGTKIALRFTSKGLIAVKNI